MHRRMDGSEYQDWVHYYNNRPFGYARQEQRHGDLLMSLWALHGSKETPKEYKSSAHWQYAPPVGDLGPEAEAALMMAKMGG